MNAPQMPEPAARPLCFEGAGVVYAAPKKGTGELRVSTEGLLITGWDLDTSDLLAPIGIDDLWQELERVWPERLVIVPECAPRPTRRGRIYRLFTRKDA